jgi:DNA-binding Xre family transcriptional regulator
MRDPTVDSLLRICDALEVDVSELMLEAEIKAEMKSVE